MNNFEGLLSSLKRSASLTEEYLASTFSELDEDTKSVEDSMKYSLFAGGKRIRPYLALEICKLTKRLHLLARLIYKPLKNIHIVTALLQNHAG